MNKKLILPKITFLEIIGVLSTYVDKDIVIDDLIIMLEKNAVDIEEKPKFVFSSGTQMCDAICERVHKAQNSLDGDFE